MTSLPASSGIWSEGNAVLPKGSGNTDVFRHGGSKPASKSSSKKPIPRVESDSWPASALDAEPFAATLSTKQFLRNVLKLQDASSNLIPAERLRWQTALNEHNRKLREDFARTNPWRLPFCCWTSKPRVVKTWELKPLSQEVVEYHGLIGPHTLMLQLHHLETKAQRQAADLQRRNAAVAPVVVIEEYPL